MTSYPYLFYITLLYLSKTCSLNLLLNSMYDLYLCLNTFRSLNREGERERKKDSAKRVFLTSSKILTL